MRGEARRLESIILCAVDGLMTGLNDTTFGPGQSLARAQFAVILHRMNNTPEVAYTTKFPDVPDGMWLQCSGQLPIRLLWVKITGRELIRREMQTVQSAQRLLCGLWRSLENNRAVFIEADYISAQL